MASSLCVDIFGSSIPSLEEIYKISEEVNTSEKNIQEFTVDVQAAQSKGNSLAAGIGWCIVGNFKNAVAELEKAKDCTQKLMYLGWAYRKVCKYEEALVCFDKVGKDVDAFAVDLEKIAVLRSQGNLEKATKLLEKHSKLNGESADYHYVQAMLNEFAGDHQSAVEQLQKAVDINPNHSKALFRLAFLCDIRGDEEMAVDYYQELLAHRPAYVSALLNLAVVYEDMGKFDEALDCVDTVLAAFPNHPRALLFLKDIESSMNMYYDEDKEKHKDKRNQILETPITDFELSVRSRNCLKKMNIRTLGDLARISENELLSYKNFGETSLREIRQIMDIKGLRLGIVLEEKKEEGEAQGQEEPEENIILTKSISELELSVRAKKALENLNVFLIGELVKKTEAELLGCKNFGVTSLNEIKLALTAVGLELRTIE